MDEKTYQFIQDNVPNATRDEIEKAYTLNNNDTMNTLIFLMKIPSKVKPPQTVWEERREICDARDAEIQKVLKAPKSF